MKELVELQKKVLKQDKEIKALTKQLTKLEENIGKDVTALKAEASEVLKKASALVNPYSPNTLSSEK